MGCDIHWVLERKHGEKWIGMRQGDYQWVLVWDKENNVWKRDLLGPKAKSRNYDLFAAIAGVRGPGPDPKGLPEDASDLTLMVSDSEDWHSHSWLPADEFLQKCVETMYDAPRVLMAENDTHPAIKQPYLYWLWEDDPEDYGEGLPEYRVVFWFDN